MKAFIFACAALLVGCASPKPVVPQTPDTLAYRHTFDPNPKLGNVIFVEGLPSGTSITYGDFGDTIVVLATLQDGRNEYRHDLWVGSTDNAFLVKTPVAYEGSRCNCFVAKSPKGTFELITADDASSQTIFWNGRSGRLKMYKMP